MTGRTLFGVIVRSIGFVVVCWGVYSTFYALAQIVRLVPATYGVITHCTFAVFYLLCGVLILRGAEKIVSFTYKPIDAPQAGV